jgi:cyclopropane-fatty-acyl-phospholipid synthase
LPVYFRLAWRVLAPGGLFLNQGIVAAPAHPRPTFPVRASRGTFIDRYIFPDGELVPLGEILRAAEPVGFELRDVENLRAHYALMLRHWLRRLEGRHGEAAALVGESTYRAWRLYLGGCASTFADGRLGVIQMLLVPPDRAGRARIPLTREDLYAAGSGSLARTVDARAWASAQSRDGQSIG